MPAPPCGRLDVGDRQLFQSTAEIPAIDQLALRDAATRSHTFDGHSTRWTAGSSVLFGNQACAKIQTREHETVEVIEKFEEIRRQATIPAPVLLTVGTLRLNGNSRWWSVMEKIPHIDLGLPSRVQLEQVGYHLRRWHEEVEPSGLRLDAAGALGIFLGSMRQGNSTAYLALSDLVAEATIGEPMTAVHSDLAASKNALFQAEMLAAFIDPGAIQVAPPMLDLAWSLAVDMPRGGDKDALLRGYGRRAVDKDRLEALLPLMMIRRMIDCRHQGDSLATRWMKVWLKRHFRCTESHPISEVLT